MGKAAEQAAGAHPTPAQELFQPTPEALRSLQDTAQLAGRPGERTPSRSSRSLNRRPSSVAPAPKGGRSRMRRCGDALGFVPWLALAALALLVAGLVVFAMQAKGAAAAADALLGAVGADQGAGFPSAMSAWDSSIWATVGVGGAACAFLFLLAAVRLDQKLRRAGKYGRARGSYDIYLFKLYTCLGVLGAAMAALLALWAALNVLLLGSWAAQAWNLEKGSAVAANSTLAWGSMSLEYSHAVEVLAGAGGVHAATLGKGEVEKRGGGAADNKEGDAADKKGEAAAAKDAAADKAADKQGEKEQRRRLAQVEVETTAAPATTGEPTVGAATATAVPGAVLPAATLPATAQPATTQPAGAAMPTLLVPAQTVPAAAAAGAEVPVQPEPAAQPLPTAVPVLEAVPAAAAVPDVAAAAPAPAPAAAAPAKVAAPGAKAEALAAVKKMAARISEVPAGANQTDGLCPSAACLNLALYPFTRSQACVCSAPSIQGVSALAGEAYDAMLWPMVGVACVCAGALLGAMDLALGTAMLGADQRFLKIAKRRASRPSRGGESPPKEERTVSFTMSADSHAFGSRPGSYSADRGAYYQMLPPGTVAPQKTASGAFVVHARA